MVNIWLIMGFHCYGGSPIAGSSIMENPIKMDDLGVLGNLHVCVYIIIYIYIYWVWLNGYNGFSYWWLLMVLYCHSWLFKRWFNQQCCGIYKASGNLFEISSDILGYFYLAMGFLPQDFFCRGQVTEVIFFHERGLSYSHS